MQDFGMSYSDYGVKGKGRNEGKGKDKQSTGKKGSGKGWKGSNKGEIFERLEQEGKGNKNSRPKPYQPWKRHTDVQDYPQTSRPSAWYTSKDFHTWENDSGWPQPREDLPMETFTLSKEIVSLQLESPDTLRQTFTMEACTLWSHHFMPASYFMEPPCPQGTTHLPMETFTLVPHMLEFSIPSGTQVPRVQRVCTKPRIGVLDKPSQFHLQ